MKGTTKKHNSQEGGFLNFLKRLMATALLLMKNVLTSLRKNVLVHLGCLSKRFSHSKKIYGSVTTLVYSNKNLNAIIKTVKSLEDAGLLIKHVTGNI